VSVASVPTSDVNAEPTLGMFEVLSTIDTGI
jgi:hypothetical protein